MDIPKGATEFKTTITSADASSAVTVQSGTANQTMYVVDVIISVDTASNYQLQDEDDTAIMEQVYLAANGGLAKTFNKIPLEVSTGKDLEIVAGASGNVSVTVTGYTL